MKCVKMLTIFISSNEVSYFTQQEIYAKKSEFRGTETTKSTPGKLYSR